MASDAVQVHEWRRSEFEEVVLPHLDAVHNLALKLTRDPARAEDLAQDVFVRAFRFFPHFTRGTNCRAWLYTIVRNTFINSCRRRRREPEAIDLMAVGVDGEARALDLESAAPSPEESAGDLSLRAAVEEALGQLPPDFRMVAVLSLVEGHTYQEVATIMDCPIGTVMSRLSRARRALQAALRCHATERGLCSRARLRGVAESASPAAARARAAGPGADLRAAV